MEAKVDSQLRRRRRSAARRPVTAALVCALATPLAAAEPAPEPPAAEQERASSTCPLRLAEDVGERRPPRGAPNILFIAVDTLRADHLGTYRHERPTSPHIDRLANDAWVYERAVAPAPWTSPSFAGILTGRAPGELGIGPEPRVLPEDVPTLAEELADRGYANAGVVSHFFIGEKFGYHRGFHFWDERQAGGHRVVSTGGVASLAEACLEEMASLERPFFLFAHFFDPHYDYLAHPEFPFYEGYEGKLRKREHRFAELRRLAKRNRLDAADYRYLRDLYDSEIAHTDAGIGRLLAALERHGLYDRTLIVLLADHGEMFGDRGVYWIGHTKYLFEELIRVPLLIKPPKRPGGSPSKGRLATTVSLLDVMPTVLDTIEPGEHGERSLLPEGGGRLPDRLVFSQTRRWRSMDAVYDGTWKLVKDRESGRVLLYDLARDPGERRNLARDHLRRLTEMTEQLDLWSKSLELLAAQRGDQPTPELSREELEAMRSLGYID